MMDNQQMDMFNQQDMMMNDPGMMGEEQQMNDPDFLETSEYGSTTTVTTTSSTANQSVTITTSAGQSVANMHNQEQQLLLQLHDSSSNKENLDSNADHEISLKKIEDMEDEYGKVKLALLNDIKSPSVISPTPMEEPTFLREQKVSKVNPDRPLERARSRDNLEIIFGSSHIDEMNKDANHEVPMFDDGEDLLASPRIPTPEPPQPVQVYEEPKPEPIISKPGPPGIRNNPSQGIKKAQPAAPTTGVVNKKPQQESFSDMQRRKEEELFSLPSKDQQQNQILDQSSNRHHDKKVLKEPHPALKKKPGSDGPATNSSLRTLKNERQRQHQEQQQLIKRNRNPSSVVNVISNKSYGADDEQYSDLLSPELISPTDHLAGKLRDMPGTRGASGGQPGAAKNVYTIPEVSEEEEESPLGGDGVSKRRKGRSVMMTVLMMTVTDKKQDLYIS